MIIVDANIITYFFMGGLFQESCQQVLKKDAKWCVPSLWKSEFRNVLMVYVMTKKCTLVTAKKVMQEAEGLFSGNEFPVLSDSVLQLASESKCSAYDCEYVALAKELGVSLVTLDKKILKCFPKIAVNPEGFLK